MFPDPKLSGPVDHTFHFPVVAVKTKSTGSFRLGLRPVVGAASAAAPAAAGGVYRLGPFTNGAAKGQLPAPAHLNMWVSRSPVW